MTLKYLAVTLFFAMAATGATKADLFTDVKPAAMVEASTIGSGAEVAADVVESLVIVNNCPGSLLDISVMQSNGTGSLGHWAGSSNGHSHTFTNDGVYQTFQSDQAFFVTGVLEPNSTTLTDLHFGDTAEIFENHEAEVKIGALDLFTRICRIRNLHQVPS